MIDSKIMSGKNIISKLNFERYYADCKSVLVICDLSAEICGAKSKIKKAFPKEIKIDFAKIKASDYAEVRAIDSCLQKLKEIDADLIICAGGQVACNIGKAVKYIATTGVGCFADFCKLRFRNKGMADGEVTGEDSEEIEQLNMPIKTIYIASASGDHAAAFKGAFEVFDSKEKIFYRFDKKLSTPDIVMVDEKMLDKLSMIAEMGMELGVLAMSLLSLNYCDEEVKIAARTAIKIVSGDTKPSICDLYVAEMTAGHCFLSIENNLLQEAIFGVQRKTSILFSQALVLMMRKSFDKLVDGVSEEDISLLGAIYAIELANDSVEEWKKSLYNVIEAKLNKYFEDKDIPKCLNQTGLNSDDIEEIFEELELSFGKTEVLARLKDLTYASY